MAELKIPDKNYFSIGEVSRITSLKPYILRYWESEFNLLRPARRDSGQRKYTRDDIARILKVKKLLYEQKFSIAGAKRFLLDEKKKGPQQLRMELGETAVAVDLMHKAKKELSEIIKILS
ncbi:MAG: MerR family transcriptional regulator [Elusimicrobia bacterium]|nr:MerR family transcriptional regulator [Elusimicrobiota bacterium]MBD3411994.1 MerR family transcriptional regulator [Elusimicrobiota bacterium]